MTGRTFELLVSRETQRRLAIYADLLEKWNGAISLVSRRSLADGAQRHFDDSLQLWPLCKPDARHWVDLGSGGGFPGLVLAVLAADLRPELRFTLVEADARKAAFLSAVARETGVSVEVIVARIENLAPLGADVISARALAPLPRLLGLAVPHLAKGAIALFPKGATVERELAEALALWRFSVQKVASLTDPSGVILKLGDITRA